MNQQKSSRKHAVCCDLVHTKKRNKSSLFQNIRTFVFCLCAVQFIQVMGSGYNKSTLTSIERRYGLDSSMIGLMQSSFHIGNLTFILYVSYFGSKWHRPRTIAIGTLTMSLSCILTSAPQFLGERYKPDVYYDENIAFNLQAFNDNTRTAFQNDSRKQFEAVTTNVFTGRLNSTQLNGNNRKQKNNSSFHKVFLHAQNFSCDFNKSLEEMNSTKLSLSNNYSSLHLFILVGSILKGIGHTPVHPLGMSFIDDYSSRRNSPLYIGLISSFSLLGPTFGFLLGSFSTNIWVDFGWVNSTTIHLDVNNSKWVGAWWMGNLLFAFLLFFCSILLFMFSKNAVKEDEFRHTYCLCIDRFRRNKKILRGNGYEGALDETTSNSSPFQEEKNNRTDSLLYSQVKNNPVYSFDVQSTKKALDLLPANSESLKVQKNGNNFITHCSEKLETSSLTPNVSTFKDFAQSLFTLFKNPIFLSMVLGHVCVTSAVATLVTYTSKYMEIQFHLSASSANFINGVINLPMAVIGNVVGGILVRFQNTKIKRILLIIIIALVFAVTLVFVLLLVGCDNDHLSQLQSNSLSSCHRVCPCSISYMPVCDTTLNKTYWSACHVGCAEVQFDNIKTIYYDCSCLGGYENLSPEILRTVVKGVCNADQCNDNSFLLYKVLMSLSSFAIGMAGTPSMLVLLQIVSTSNKALGIGVVFVFTRICAWIPSPIYVGYLIDSACFSRSNQQCEVYKKKTMRYNMFGAVEIQIISAIIFYALSYNLYARRQSSIEETVNENLESVNENAL